MTKGDGVEEENTGLVYIAGQGCGFGLGIDNPPSHADLLGLLLH